MAERPNEAGAHAAGENGENWRSPQAVVSRRRLGLGLTLFVIVMFVLPVVAKYFRWF